MPPSAVPSGPEDTATVLLLFALLAHLVSWCFATYISINAEVLTTRRAFRRIAVAFAALGTIAWLIAVLLRMYTTSSLVVFVTSCLVTGIILMFVLLFVAVVV